MPPPRRVPHRDAVDPSWADQAACRELDPDLFFPETQRQEHHALTVCRTCPVRIRCLNHALDNHETTGIWGGLTPRQRKRYRRIA